MEKLAALCNSYFGAWRCSIVTRSKSATVSFDDVALQENVRVGGTGGLRVQFRGTGAPAHRRCDPQSKWGLVVDVDALWNVRQGDHVDVVGGVGRCGFDRRGLN